MTIPRTTARKLCTDVEFRLVDESFAPVVSDLSERALAQRVRRARTARDKYRSLSDRQTREATGRIAPRGARPAKGNTNTVVKQKIFDETLQRYEKRLSSVTDSPAKKDRVKVPSLSKLVSAAAKASSPKTTRSGKTSAARSNVSKKASSAVEPADKRGRKTSVLGDTNPKGPAFPRVPHERGRHSGMHKQFQARRDSR